MRDLQTANLDNLTVAEFEAYLPELFAAGGGKITENPRFTNFLAANPDCAALVKDLETIAEHAKSLFEPTHDPSDKVWSNIASRMKDSPALDEDDN